MLTFDDKRTLFFSCLNDKNGSYGDDVRDEIIFYFDDLENDLGFLDKFQSEEEIYNFTNMLISKIIMNEHQDSFENILIYYCQ